MDNFSNPSDFKFVNGDDLSRIAISNDRIGTILNERISASSKPLYGAAIAFLIEAVLERNCARDNIPTGSPNAPHRAFSRDVSAEQMRWLAASVRTSYVSNENLPRWLNASALGERDSGSSFPASLPDIFPDAFYTTADMESDADDFFSGAPIDIDPVISISKDILQFSDCFAYSTTISGERDASGFDITGSAVPEGWVGSNSTVYETQWLNYGEQGTITDYTATAKPLIVGIAPAYANFEYSSAADGWAALHVYYSRNDYEGESTSAQRHFLVKAETDGGVATFSNANLRGRIEEFISRTGVYMQRSPNSFESLTIAVDRVNKVFHLRDRTRW